jgi:tetratricopeptide (TPR) repeat protein
MRLPFVAALLVAVALPASAADPIAEARRLYNLGQYDAAERLAREATAVPATVNTAHVVLGRIQLERYRQSADPVDLKGARASLTSVDPGVLDARDRVELMIGLAEALYLEDRFAAAAELFESVFERSAMLGNLAHERVLDWWATAVDRHAQRLPLADRTRHYARINERMHAEILATPGSPAAGYWLAASARAAGDPDGAWHHATAGWLRAAFAEDRGAALRADLDRLVVQAIIPERAARLSASGDVKLAQTSMLTEWEAFKAAWSK